MMASGGGHEHLPVYTRCMRSYWTACSHAQTTGPCKPFLPNVNWSFCGLVSSKLSNRTAAKLPRWSDFIINRRRAPKPAGYSRPAHALLAVNVVCPCFRISVVYFTYFCVPIGASRCALPSLLCRLIYERFQPFKPYWSRDAPTV